MVIHFICRANIYTFWHYKLTFYKLTFYKLCENNIISKQNNIISKQNNIISKQNNIINIKINIINQYENKFKIFIKLKFILYSVFDTNFSIKNL